EPRRIYLGGHSTGGTLVMLVAEATTKFRAVFAFGPVSDVRNYGGKFVYHDVSSKRETELRAPSRWLDSVKRPLFVIDGVGGNIEDLRYMEAHKRKRMRKVVPIPGKDHFSVLAPANELIASKILGDSGAMP